MNVNKNNYRNRNQTSRFNAQVCHGDGLCKDSEDNEMICAEGGGVEGWGWEGKRGVGRGEELHGLELQFALCTYICMYMPYVL